MAFSGHNNANATSPLVALYFARKSMAKLGYKTSFDELDEEDAEIFLAIENKINKIKERETKRGARRKN